MSHGAAGAAGAIGAVGAAGTVGSVGADSRPATGAPAAGPPGIAVEGRLVFPGDWSVGPLALELPAGRWTVLLGPSGVGKSSLLRLIAGLPAGGWLDGSIAASDGEALVGRVAWMGQSDLLAPWLDILGNVTLGARLRGERADRDRARALIAEVGLAGREDARASELSGGQRQRVALARTLMEDRPVVLLDEPFSALDARTRAEMQALAFRALAGRTVVLVTHDPGEAARLGHAVWLMTERGIEAAPVAPPGPPLRDPVEPGVQAAQAALWSALCRPRPAPDTGGRAG